MSNFEIDLETVDIVNYEPYRHAKTYRIPLYMPPDSLISAPSVVKFGLQVDRSLDVFDTSVYGQIH